ncbi:MAG: lamin tail domain-containing protein [Chloroflexi bacterium]|nr:lamin tail domain-containing protein [Chloroflexota bacterium]
MKPFARLFPALSLFLLLILGLVPTHPAQAVGETSTRFGIFIPPNGENTTRDPTLIVTAVQDNTTVDIIDDNGDNDSDDTITGLTLNTGQSHIIYIQEGAVNDDLGGKQDGDYFRITATKPVIIANLTVNTDWQHDFLPADNRRMSGTSFYLYRPKGFSQAHANNKLLNIFAFNDHTDIQIFDITQTPKTTSGTTTVVPEAQGTLIFSTTLDKGEDLLEVNGLTPSLPEGRTFHIISNKDVTVQFGSLAKGQSGSRDGGSYVPGKNGTSADKTFYFVIPYEYATERELRLVSYDKPANVTVRGWNTSSHQWVTVATVALPKFGHEELVGTTELGANYYFFEVTANETISVFETNWLETGSFGTSDIITFLSAQNGSGAGQSFLAYMGPPGLQLGVQLSHLYVYSYQPVTGIAYDPDSYGEYIELYNNSGQTVNLAGWQLTNEEGYMLTLPTGATIASGGTYLLEYHQKATNAAASYVYGTAYPKFKLGNGSDTLTLHNPSGTAVDTVAYSDTGWAAHGVYYALERKNPNQPFTASNARNSATHVNTGSNNLGDYYGTPKQHSGSSGNGQGTVIINELMSGRIYESFSIPANSYYDVSLTVDEWLAIHNGTNPGAQNTPENPYLVVETDAPVSVMNANWNDNWLAYGTGTLQPDPLVNHTADYYERTAGEAVVFTTYVSNQFNELFNPVTRITLPPEILYTPGSYQTPSQLAGVTPTQVQNSDGSWTLTWVHNQTLSTDEVLRFQVWGTVDPGLSQNTLMQSVALVDGLDVIGSRYASQDSAVVNVGVDELTTITDIVINEVLAYPRCGSEWIEIHNRSTNDINIGGWELADEDGFIYRFPDLTFIPNDAYLTVYLGDGVNSGTNYFTGDAFAGALDNGEDQVSLYTSAVHNVATLVDFVQWDNNNSLAHPEDDDLAVTAGKWPSGGYVSAPVIGQSLGRDRQSTNSFTPADWDGSGGPHSAGVVTPGALNVSIPNADITPPGSVTNIQITPLIGQEGTLQLTWHNPTAGDLAGVKVLRDDDTYPASLNDGTLVYDGLDSTFTDTGITPGAAAYYTLLAYDDSGNIACPTTTSQTRAIAPQRIYVVYEDLKGVGWVDWDTNDLILIQDSAVQLNSQGISQIKANFYLEARGSSYDHTLNFTVDVNGASTATLKRYAADGTLQATETSNHNGFVDLEIFASTRTSLPPTHAGGTANVINGTPRQEGPFVEVTINLSNAAANPPETAQLPPFDPWLHVINTGQNIHLLEAGYVSDSQRVWDATSPLSGRDIPLAHSFNQTWAWPTENHAIWLAYPNYAAYLISGQTLNTTWYNFPDPAHLWTPGNPLAGNGAAPTPLSYTPTTANSLAGWPQMTNGLVFASPLIVDLDGDGDNELIAAAQDKYVYIWQADGTALPGWPKYVYDSVRSSPAVGDIDGDGDLELLIGADNGRLYAWQHTGAAAPGFPLELGHSLKATPALANLDADPALEIVVHTTGAKLYVLNGNGTAFPGWPQQMNGVPEAYGNFITGSTPAIGDMDADNIPEIVVGSTDGRVYAYRLDGSPLSPLWPIQTRDWVYASPVIVDLNQDGYRDVVTTSGDGRLYAWRGDGVALPGFPVRVRGGIVASPAVVDLDGDGDLEVMFGTVAGQVYAVHHDGTLVDGWPREVGAPIHSSPIVGDIDGDTDLELIIGAHDGALHAWHHDGIPVVDWPLQTADWIVSTPTLGDLNGDGLLEVAVGSYDKGVYVWQLSGPYDPAHLPWPAFHGGRTHAGFVPTTPPIQPLPEIHRVFMPFILKQ